MSFSHHYDEATQVCELHVQGLLKRADLAAVEAAMSPRIDAGERPRVLVVLKNFGGWQKGDDWVDADFMFTRGDKIAKIAIVGAGNKQSELKAFSGAGLRPTPVEFFDSTETARAWLLES